MRQEFLDIKKEKPIPNTTWGKPQYNKIKDNKQRIELSRGCINGCPWCYEPHIPKIEDVEVFEIPKIKKNHVEILDMNFLWQPNIIRKIKDLGKIKVNNKVVYYEEICGLDYRLMTQEIANELKKARFIKVRLAWDGSIKEQYRIKDTINMLIKAGYKAKQLSLFMLVNWKIPKIECERKLDIMKVWNVKVCDCCYDGGYANAIPKDWKERDIREFRSKCRKHNQIVNFGIDPEL